MMYTYIYIFIYLFISLFMHLFIYIHFFIQYIYIYIYMCRVIITCCPETCQAGSGSQPTSEISETPGPQNQAGWPCKGTQGFYGVWGFGVYK